MKNLLCRCNNILLHNSFPALLLINLSAAGRHLAKLMHHIEFKLVFPGIMALVIISCVPGNKKVKFTDPEGYYKEVYYINKDSVKTGIYLKYYTNGTLADSCQYVDGKIQGQRKLWSEEGALEILETYQNGIFEGPYQTYYPEGQLKKKQNYLANKIQGEVKEFYKNGKLKAVVQFIDNLENGPFSEYYENGKLHYEGFFEGGDFEQDTLKEYDKDGVLIRKLFCEKGICQTVWRPETGYTTPKKIFVQEKKKE